MLNTLRKMFKRDLYFFRLDANQAAVIVGIFEMLSIISLYLIVGVVVGALVQVVRAANDHDKDAYAVMAVLFLISLIPLIFPLLLLIGAVKGNRCMMLPWIIFGWLRIIVATFSIFASFAYFPLGSSAQVFVFASHVIYYVMTVYSLIAVTNSYMQMRLIET